ncbi:MAG: tRNA epoxyqueuosine(34) reductase QueG, partial [Chloroflexi bacterium]|nr:tRNA epoxyqueuosine(34) reductase QueG [Chloroflexota bacterium]
AVIGSEVQSRWYTDTGPMQDLAVAERAGLGWFGKNTNVLTAIGSWVLLAQVLINLDLEPDAPSKKSCGSCMRCVDACPTGAIVAPGVLDNRLCISYLTIENRGTIPRALREQVGDWIFGCDICQDVCPVNRKATLGSAYREFSRDAEQNARPELTALLAMDEPVFHERFRGSPVLRAKLAGLKRNVCVALGNIGDPRVVPALAVALRDEPSPIVRGHAAWALGRIGGDAALLALREALIVESDDTVREELGLALGK